MMMMMMMMMRMLMMIKFHGEGMTEYKVGRQERGEVCNLFNGKNGVVQSFSVSRTDVIAK